jgi:hypothetical protein
MQFCPKCNNILDISKSFQKTKFTIDDETQTTVSDTEDEVQNANDLIIQKLLKNEELKQNEIASLEPSVIQKQKMFTELSNKDKLIVQKKMNEIYDKKTSNTTSAYRVCKNCMYHEPIPNNSLIVSRMSESDVTGYSDIKQYENYIYIKTLPRTRHYICPNSACVSHKEHDQREAVFYRPDPQIYQTWYTCCACKKYWRAH